MTKKIWDCRVGEIDAAKLPKGSDAPMRDAVREAYYKLTGEYPEFLFSGWGAQLDEMERTTAEDSVLPEKQE